MKKFIIKVLIFLVPTLLFVLLYVIVDPFKVVKDHDSYISNYVMLHRGYVSTKVFLKNEPKYHFNSFIFGSSRSCAHSSHEWEKYLPDSDRAFSFGSWDESFEGIYQKLKLIDKYKYPVKNVLIVVDTDRSFKESNAGKGDHYLVTNMPKFEFHYNYLKQFLDINLFITSIDYSLFHIQRPYMKDFVGMKEGDLDLVNNDWMPNSEAEILKDTVAYYRDCMKDFYERPVTQQFCPKQIDQENLAVLKNIQAIFKKHHTNCIFVIAPVYDQLKLNPSDLVIMQQLFGENNIFDYSGINSITNNKYNYCSDVKHYRHKIGDQIFKEIYAKKEMYAKK